LVGFTLLASCATVPETGRSQLLLVSPAQESQLGFQEFEKLKKTVPISGDPAANAQLQRVGQRIAAVAPLQNARWEFVLFDKPDVPNAFCLPGGKVGIYSGILPITKDDAGLATVDYYECQWFVFDNRTGKTRPLGPALRSDEIREASRTASSESDAFAADRECLASATASSR